MLDLDDPTEVINRPKAFIIEPFETWELRGDVPNVVFPCGLIQESDNTLKMYYGAADTCIAVAESALDDILKLFT